IVNFGATNNTVGGTTSGARNIISGNTTGVDIDDFGIDTTGNVVQGNYLGTDYTGTQPLGNNDGVTVDTGASYNTIGGTTSGARNVISGNVRNGIFLMGSGATYNVVEGNYVGTDVSGKVALGNQNDGIAVE